MDFERWFNERTSRFERLLIKSAAVLLFVLLVSQALLINPQVRSRLSLVERLEGVPYEQEVEQEQETSARPPVQAETFYLELSVINEIDASLLSVYVNGEKAATFGNDGTAKVEVHDGDLVEVDGDHSIYDIEVVVSAISDGVVSPEEGQVVTYFGRPETISWVVVQGN
ncbi:hypothetical protein [Dethiobacter alkaliphilus]|uniref:Uncharacterized protein n=1 Tax=Dethiobacter alkaliphilus AHT 1 TaxID=555088 RepID=C0GDV4_DETAL|nr:hypothetical protein [Dethiobacter alkaliphilus]EEG78248.1 conserved hypothetical protein [Dethiobacter alkaliphilus AHT 1]